MRKSKTKNQLFEYGIFLIIILFFCYNILGLLGSFGSAEEPYIVEYGSIVQENEYDCLILRDETLVFSEKSGEVNYKVNEGDKVRKGYKLYEIGPAEVNENSKEDTPFLDIKTAGEYMRVSYDTLDVQKQVQDIRRLSANGIYEGITLIEHAIDEKIMQTGKKEFSEEPVERYSGTYSPMSGIISFKVDGYEEILNRKSVRMLDMGKVYGENIDSTSIKVKKTDTEVPILKIVDNSVWYVYVYTDLRNIDRFKEGARVKIVFEDEDVDAAVIETNSEIGNCFVILRINEQASALFGTRMTRMHIINKNIVGLIVPANALVYQEDEIGVLIKDLNGKAVFKPVGVKGANSEWAVVSDGVFYRKDEEGNEESVNTVKVYDEIIVDISE
ncbi:MAG: hypothetical protein JJE29_00915 [Peptostreptococcaceae bacterium]|nr:hypothetical protein [Peptostreptococcaceae bacterium]